MADGCPLGVELDRWEELGSLVEWVESDLPRGGVDHRVMRPTQQREVGQAGRAAFEPGDDVVGVAGDRQTSAAGEGAVPVPQDQRHPDHGSHQAVSPADVEDLACSAEHRRDQVRIAGESSHCRDRRAAPRCPTSRRRPRGRGRCSPWSTSAGGWRRGTRVVGRWSAAGGSPRPGRRGTGHHAHPDPARHGHTQPPRTHRSPPSSRHRSRIRAETGRRPSARAWRGRRSPRCRPSARHRPDRG